METKVVVRGDVGRSSTGADRRPLGRRMSIALRWAIVTSHASTLASAGMVGSPAWRQETCRTMRRRVGGAEQRSTDAQDRRAVSSHDGFERCVALSVGGLVVLAVCGPCVHAGLIEAELMEDGHPVVEVDLLGDEAVLYARDRDAGELHRLAAAGRELADRHVVGLGPFREPHFRAA